MIHQLFVSKWKNEYLPHVRWNTIDTRAFLLLSYDTRLIKDDEFGLLSDTREGPTNQIPLFLGTESSQMPEMPRVCPEGGRGN